MEVGIDAHRDRLAGSLRRCDADLGSPFARGLFANCAYAPAGVGEEGPVDYEALAGWLLGHRGAGEGRAAPSAPRPPCAAGPPEPPQVVRLNVGGRPFATNASTLAKAPPGSLLRRLPLGPPDGSGCHSISRDGSLFAYVLNFLRDSDNFAMPADLAERQGLYREACYYGLAGLARVVQGAGACEPAESSDAERAGARLECLTTTAKSLLDMPVAVISLADDRPRRSGRGCGLSYALEPKGTIGGIALASLPQDLEVLVIEDAAADPRTQSNPEIVGGQKIGFYAGCPLVAHDGSHLGALCVIDHVPRKLKQWQRQLLVSLSYLAVQELHWAELEKARIPKAGSWETIDELTPTPPSSTNGTVARREAWRRSCDGGVARPASYASGVLRLTRMREALKEMVCLVQVSCGCMSWPVLYANRTCSDLLGLRTPPVDSAVGLDRPGRPGDLRDRPCFWDHFALDAGVEEEALLQSMRVVWEAQELPHVFGLMARAAPGGGHRQVSCRFAPVHEPLDVAAGAVKAGAGRPGVYPRGSAPECYLYFVLMVFATSPPPARTQRAPPAAGARG